MAKLILSMDGLVLKEIHLTKERTTVGRKPSNDIQIDNLAVSGEHAVIVTILNDSFLEDLGSTNGTLVNGNLVKKHFLQSNDVIELGKYKLKYLSEQPGSAAGGDFEKTMVLRAPAKPKAPDQTSANFQPTQLGPDTVSMAEPKLTESKPAAAKPVEAKPAEVEPPAAAKPAEPFKPAESFKPVEPPKVAEPPKLTPMAEPKSVQATAPATPSKSGQIASIQILTGPSAGKELDLTKSLTTLGKPGVQVAVITKRPQGYFITHVEGAAFPVVNGKTLDAQAHPLNDHDIIELGGVKMEFFYKTP
ncbi:MAG: FHA domain-containing protein [Burkholderiales bacterium]